MANEQNLIPVTKLSKEEAKKIQSAGGKARGEQLKKQKTFKELAQKLLSLTVPSKMQAAIKENFPEIKDDELTAKMAMLYMQFNKCVKDGDSKAFEVLRDTAGEKPIEDVNLKGNIIIKYGHRNTGK
jgi:hypothetical protein